MKHVMMYVTSYRHCSYYINVHHYNGIRLISEKGHILSSTGPNVDAAHVYCDEGKKPESEVHVLHDSILVTFWKSDPWLPGAGCEARSWLQRDTEIFRDDGIVSMGVVITWLCIFQNSRNCMLKCMIFTVCKFYLNLTTTQWMKPCYDSGKTVIQYWMKINPYM